MEIKEVKTIEELKELYDCSAMTWEGLVEEDFPTALKMCCKEGENGIGYVTRGATMNNLCRLTGSNAYPDDLKIFSIKNFVGLAIQFGARWMDDIINNNAYRENYHPFK